MREHRWGERVRACGGAAWTTRTSVLFSPLSVCVRDCRIRSRRSLGTTVRRVGGGRLHTQAREPGVPVKGVCMRVTRHI